MWCEEALLSPEVDFIVTSYNRDSDKKEIMIEKLNS